MNKRRGLLWLTYFLLFSFIHFVLMMFCGLTFFGLAMSNASRSLNPD